MLLTRVWYCCLICSSILLPTRRLFSAFLPWFMTTVNDTLVFVTPLPPDLLAPWMTLPLFCSSYCPGPWFVTFIRTSLFAYSSSQNNSELNTRQRFSQQVHKTPSLRDTILSEMTCKHSSTKWVMTERSCKSCLTLLHQYNPNQPYSEGTYTQKCHMLQNLLNAITCDQVVPNNHNRATFNFGYYCWRAHVSCTLSFQLTSAGKTNGITKSSWATLARQIS